MRAVIMGGTAGIGLAVATRLTGAGLAVTVTGRDPGRLAAVRGQVAAAEQLDGTIEADVAAFFERLGPFEHLVLAFGPATAGFATVKSLSADRLRSVVEPKLYGYLTAVAHARVTGSVTLLSAGSARVARPGTVALAAVNGGLEAAVRPLAVELAPVRVNAVSPGVIDTSWWAGFSEEQRAAQFAAVAEATPVGRVGQPDDVARAVEYLVHADFVTGTVLPVDGGLTLPR
ncbi:MULTISPECIES: SDR family oxidoreductase [unclassified Streptomyces]|uniref:SDR family oxidoreductase n=1 Tax=unclassified Streptomyces TaxID=2593676 RepID=UPI00380DA35E